MPISFFVIYRRSLTYFFHGSIVNHMKKTLILSLAFIIILSISSTALEPNESKAVHLGFANAAAVKTFSKKVITYGMALSYLKAIDNGKASALGWGKFNAEDVKKARAFIENNREFDDKLNTFLSETSEVYGVEILGIALENAYQAGLRGGPDQAFLSNKELSVQYAIDEIIKKFRDSYENQINNSVQALNEIRFVRLENATNSP